ncbi:MAG: IS256 family transposase [Oscillospiraceae bacterium]|nr:IS256 family transposase [Oscillospiraceae bacterium]
MSDFNTKLMNALLKGDSVDEFFCQHLEAAVNDLLQAELSSFLGYEKYDSAGWGSGNNRNGSYKRTFKTRYGELNIVVPRDRNGGFHQHTLPDYQRRSDALETTIIQLYRKGISTREISDLIEKMYGHHYTPTTVSNIARTVKGQVDEFHSRNVSARYAVVYCDATYLSLRRDCVAKEALHVILGITPDGSKEILEYALYPSESAVNYEEMLTGLKQRGLKEVLLFVSDGLAGMADAVKRQFPKADHQSCWVHLSRSVARVVREKDRKEVLGALRVVYTQEDAASAEQELDAFIEKYEKKYPKIRRTFSNRASLFSFYKYPKSIRQSIYTSNLIENNNKGLKHRSKVKEQFPNEPSLERFVCCYYSEYNRKHSGRVHKGFGQAEFELLEMFSQRYSAVEEAASQDAA